MYDKDGREFWFVWFYNNFAKIHPSQTHKSHLIIN